MNTKRIAIIASGVVFGAVLFFFVRLNQFYQKIYQPKKNSQKVVEKTAYNILLLGYGGGAHEGTYLTDTIMVMHVDLQNKKNVLVSIPRDVWVKVPTKKGETFHAKINTVYQMGLFPQDYSGLDPKFVKNQPETSLVSHVLQQVTGLPIDYYITVDFEGFKKAVDVLGGVDIKVENSFTDTQYPIAGKEKDLCDNEEQFKKVEPYLNNDSSESTDSSKIEERNKLFKEKPELEEFLKNATESPELAFPCRYETLTFKVGTANMDGETALKYVRSRNSPQGGGDFGRAKRQQQFLEATKDKVLSIGFIPKVIPFLDELDDHIKTDVPLDQLQKFLAEAGNASQYKTTRLVLTEDGYLESSRSKDGQFILISKEGIDKWSSVKLWIKNSIEGKPLPPTPKEESE